MRSISSVMKFLTSFLEKSSRPEIVSLIELASCLRS